MLSKSKSVALLIAAAISIITTSFLSLVDGVPIIGLMVVFVLSFSSTYILTYFTVDVFIFGQIEKINDRINKLKVEDFSFIEEDNKPIKGDPLNRINNEILNYAKTKQSEIDQLKKAANFRREFIADISHEHRFSCQTNRLIFFKLFQHNYHQNSNLHLQILISISMVRAVT